MARPFLVEDDAGWQELARYVHLNPVRVSRLGLGKGARAGAKAGMSGGAEPELVAERLRTLREFRWSSYPGYAGSTQPWPGCGASPWLACAAVKAGRNRVPLAATGGSNDLCGARLRCPVGVTGQIKTSH